MPRCLLPLLALTLAAACARNPPAAQCRTDAQCPSAARCTSGVCLADARPTASLRAVEPVEEFALVRLDGTASADPDGDLAEHLWSIRAVDAACAAPEVSGRAPEALVRFGCAGRYEVSLSVRDALGVTSEPARTEVLVRATSGAPLLLAGPDLATDHQCGGSPLACGTSDVVRLAAEAPPGTSLRWSAQPPVGLALDATRRVTFLPSELAPTPRALIATDGTAIAGDWIFRVEAVDAYGVVGAAFTRVSVRNRLPVVAFAPAGAFEHAFDAGRSVFTSGGAVAWEVVDPDGDPVELSGLWRHVGDGEASLFDGDFDGTSVTFSVEVPYAAPEDALRLRGGPDLLRRIELYAVDANRAMTIGAFDVEIGNRPPAPVGGTFDTTVPHRFDAARGRYVASVRAGTFVDPDGDPLVDSTGGPAPCGTLRAHGNDVTVECEVAYEGIPAAGRLVGVRSIPVPARDPWDVASAVPVRSVTIENSAPLLSGAPSPATKCVVVWGSPFSGSAGDVSYEERPVTFDVQPTTTDPDGDPVLLQAVPVAGGSANPTGAVCTAAECVPFRFVEPGDLHRWPLALFPWDSSRLVASDGAAALELPVSPRWATSLYCP